MQAPPANLGNVNPHAPDELYIVAPQTSTPQSPVNNDHIPGVAHDHVVSVPAHNSGSYNAIWHVYVVACTPGNGACSGPTVTFPGPGGPGTGPTLVLAKTVNGNPLQSDAAVNAALASGAAFEIDTGIVFLCTVHAIH
jgi:hypothetical protein